MAERTQLLPNGIGFDSSALQLLHEAVRLTSHVAGTACVVGECIHCRTREALWSYIRFLGCDPGWVPTFEPRDEERPVEPDD